MPIVNILVTREGTTPGTDRTTADQKAAIYKGVADLLFNVMGKHREDTTVIFHEHEIDDISQGGMPLEMYRRRQGNDHLIHLAEQSEAIPTPFSPPRLE